MRGTTTLARCSEARGSSIKLTSFMSASEKTVAYEMGRVLSGLAGPWLTLVSLVPPEELEEKVRVKTLGGVILEDWLL